MSLDELAVITRLSYENVRMNLANMIKTGRLPCARIDERRREIILEEDVLAETPAPDAEYSPEMVVVECPNCQAPNAIRRGGIGVCEYCGQKDQRMTIKTLFYPDGGDGTGPFPRFLSFSGG